MASKSDRNLMFRVTRTRSVGLFCILTFLPALVGCGSDISQALLQAGNVAGQTAFDLLLTDLVNQLADSLTQTTSPPDTGGDPAGGDPAGGDSTGGSDFGSLTGIISAGETFYTSNGCGSCHCADAGGGCALGAPSLIGVTADSLDIHLRGSNEHPVKLTLSDQEIADLEAYLGSL